MPRQRRPHVRIIRRRITPPTIRDPSQLHFVAGAGRGCLRRDCHSARPGPTDLPSHAQIAAIARSQGGSRYPQRAGFRGMRPSGQAGGRSNESPIADNLPRKAPESVLQTAGGLAGSQSLPNPHRACVRASPSGADHAEAEARPGGRLDWRSLQSKRIVVADMAMTTILPLDEY